ncbi:hypothetical protein A3C98_01270 [Candidatus Roizmanbacteria bacterium RIFCSPHIGHO2_02_FULL_37_15]|nr:MAG: hypothetical protein A3C98_01270 [Candidatus Roizmanbacteria bacterium RIFCSPHIGHO2_02_FULL_37_15]OGK31921.1 MAG: hypothetical protein A3F57_02570 [Candidatus Roizmanbacteria bacterium RIFCSPHIGHO2_12_FULL_36_11]OGK57180.1 MAG: hypothetical protein A3I50_04260 [Candidatus Roizmanbacteria bacterium RIFCSPLOWO2_02_FULL_37_9]
MENPVRSNKNASVKGAVIVLAGLLILTIVGYLQSEKYIRNAALDGCAQYARTQEVDKQSGNTITTPENYWLTKCLEKKGYPKLAE